MGVYSLKHACSKMWKLLAGKMNTLKIPILYALVGGAGIWLSDKLFFMFVVDPGNELIINIHTLRGLLLILSSVCMISYLIQRSEKTLRESEERYRCLVELSPEPIIVHTEGEIVYINNSGMQLFGPTRLEEFIGTPIMHFVHPDYEEIVKVWTQEILQEEITTDLLELKVIRNDGQAIIIEAKAMLIIYRNKPAIRLLIRDVTRQRQADEALQENEKRLRTLINSTPDCIWFKDGEGRLHEMNEYGQRIFGLEGVPYKGKRNSELAKSSRLHSSALLFCEESDRKAWVLGGTIRTEEEIPQVDGTSKIFDFIKSPVFHADGSRQALVIIGRDITEQMQAKKRLEESETRFRSLFEHHPDAIYSFDQKGNLLAANPIAEKITGYRAEELLQQSFQLLILKKNFKSTLKNFMKTLKGQTPTYEITILHKDGHHVECSGKNVPIIVNDKIVGVYVIIKDISEHKRTQELLQKSDRLAVVGELAAGIAHEIRNPLTALKGFIQLMSSKIDEYQDYFNIMLSELDRINFIVGEFLIIAKPQAKKFSQHDPLILLQGVIKLLGPQAIINNVQISTEFDFDIPRISCEENHLKQVFINILKNAIESMPSGGEVSIQVQKKNNKRILIRFIDQGLGIPKERISKLGEPFYTTKEKGIGLGLMVSYKIIEAHQGQIDIMSEIGKGAIVDVVLPIENMYMEN